MWELGKGARFLAEHSEYKGPSAALQLYYHSFLSDPTSRQLQNPVLQRLRNVLSQVPSSREASASQRCM